MNYSNYYASYHLENTGFSEVYMANRCPGKINCQDKIKQMEEISLAKLFKVNVEDYTSPYYVIATDVAYVWQSVPNNETLTLESIEVVADELNNEDGAQLLFASELEIELSDTEGGEECAECVSE